MRLVLLFITLSISIQTYCQAQTTTDWKKYIPVQPVDSIVFLSTNKGGPRTLTHEDSITLSKTELTKIAAANEKIRNAFNKDAFPLNDYTGYLEVYEIKQYISQSKDILALLELLPNTHCQEQPSGCRCIPDYKDCVIFFYQSKPVYALKLCFDCATVYSTPDTYEARCLGEFTAMNKISAEWIKRHLIDLFERQ